MSYMINKAVEAYIDEYYPHARMMKHDDPDSGLKFYRMNELAQADRDWFPLCSYKDKKTGETVYGGRTGVIHTYMEGQTGAGKTTRYVIPAIRALAHTKHKPSFIVSDPDGENVEKLSITLRECGYEVRIINMLEPSRSDTFNPLDEAVEECLKEGKITNRAMDISRRIAEILQPIEASNDPIWDQGARAFTYGCILDKLEDMLEGYLPPRCVNLYNILQNHFWLRRKLSEGYSSMLRSIPHYARKQPDAISVQKMEGVTDNAEKTRSSYLGVVENHYDAFGQPSMYQLSSNSTLCVENIVEKPMAVFIQTGSTRVGDTFVSLIVNRLYQYIKARGRSALDKRMPRDIHCFLDEFANIYIADPAVYAQMLTDSRKNGMYWHMILQCDAQMNKRYGTDIAETIRANCTEIYLGSNDYRTQVRFAESCGRRTIVSLPSHLFEQGPYLETIPLITPEALKMLEEGYAYVRQDRHELLYVPMEAFYNCADFPLAQDIDDVYPVNDFDYTQTRMFPDEYGKPNMQEIEREKRIRQIVDSFERVEELFKGEIEYIDDEDAPAIDDEEDVSDFDDCEPSVAAITGTKLYECLQTHLKGQSREHVETVMSDLTSMPTILVDAVEACFSETYEERLPNSNILKFEIIEEYIGSNNFKSKSAWNRGIKTEVETLQKSGIFPDEIMEAFTNASYEICEELTLGNIKEIKKIISGNV